MLIYYFTQVVSEIGNWIETESFNCNQDSVAKY